MYKMIVVDDEPTSRETLCNCFPWNDMGFHICQQFNNGKSALEYIKNEHVDIVLCDICMPTMSGVELAKEVNSMNTDIKIIFLSAYREFEYAQKAIEYNITKYILKPPKYNELIETFTDLKKNLDMRNKDVSGSYDFSNSSSVSYKIINKVKEYIRTNYQNATLEDAARLVHMSPNYLSTYFKEKTNEHFSDYLLSVRMENAARLLEDYSYRTYEISEIVGYSNAKNFSRTFKKYFGKTPREYRQS